MALEEIKPEEIPEAMREAFAAAKVKHPDLFVLHGKETDVTVICKRPTRPICRKFREERAGTPSQKAEAFENLFLACLVVPTPKEFEATLDRAPMLGDAFGVAVWDSVAGTDAVSTKKA